MFHRAEFRIVSHQFIHNNSSTVLLLLNWYYILYVYDLPCPFAVIFAHLFSFCHPSSTTFVIQATFAREPFESWSYTHGAHTKDLSSLRTPSHAATFSWLTFGTEKIFWISNWKLGLKYYSNVLSSLCVNW